MAFKHIPSVYGDILTVTVDARAANECVAIMQNDGTAIFLTADQVAGLKDILNSLPETAEGEDTRNLGIRMFEKGLRENPNLFSGAGAATVN